MYFSTAVVAAFAASAYGATMQVLVGANNQLTFTPNNIQAAPGDQVQFVFQNANHTATQGTMNAACQPAAGGFASGFAPVNQNPTNPATIQGKLVGNAFLVQGKKQTAANNNNNNNQQLTNGPATFTVNVQDTNPIPVYCNQQLHCQQGMVAMINGGGQSLAQYQAMAANAKANVIATGPNGGQVSGYIPNLQTTTTTKKKGGKGGAAGAAGGLAAALQNAAGKAKGNN